MAMNITKESLEETTKTLQKFASFFDDYDKKTFDDHIEISDGLTLIAYYPDEDHLHRLDGPAKIVTYKTYNEKPEEHVEKYWYINNKMIPHWVPKIEDGLVYGKATKKIIVDVILKFDREYGNFLNKTYSAMSENKSNMQKEFQDLLLNMITFYKEIDINQLSNEIYSNMGIVVVSEESKIENPKEFQAIQKIIEENVFDMVINKLILYNEESKILSLNVTNDLQE
jgi:hypothetical protein